MRVAAFGLTVPQVGQYVKVTGISACYKTNGTRHRLIRARMQSDIVVLN